MNPTGALRFVRWPRPRPGKQFPQRLPNPLLRRPGFALARVALLLQMSCVGFLTGCGGGASPSQRGGGGGGNGGGSQTFNYFQIVDGHDYPVTVQYAYGPSIILKDGVYHAFFCSGGNIYPAWDYVRYVKSSDGGKTWSAPVDMLHGNTYLGACDPSVVYYQGFYYMFFGSAYATGPNVYQTITEVARSENIDGPYLTYTERGTWEDTPSDAKFIIKPLVFHDTNPTGYGAGQPTVVVHNDKLLMWYTDDSEDPEFYASSKYMLESADPVTWTPSPDKRTNSGLIDSVDVKYDAGLNQFVMTHIAAPFSPGSSLTRSYSSDGLTWSSPQVVINPNDFPGYTNNVGVAGDELGNTIPSSTLVGFGKDYGSVVLMDMYGVFVNPP